LRAFRFVGIPLSMSGARIDEAIARIEAALARIDAARALPVAAEPDPAASAEGTARVTALVNSHEKLREEVADTLRELDAVISELDQ